MGAASFCHRCGVPLEDAEQPVADSTALDLPGVTSDADPPTTPRRPPTAPEVPRRRAVAKKAGRRAVAKKAGRRAAEPARVDDEAETNDLTAGHPGSPDPHAVEAVTIPPAIFEEGWEPWAVVNPLPDHLSIRGRRWLLVDRVDPADRASAELHDFEILGADMVTREEGEGLYPTGSPVYSVGLRQQGGVARFVVHNLRPKSPVAIVRQVLVLGPERTSVRIDGEKVGSIEADEHDREYVWRNRIFAVGAHSVTRGDLNVEFCDEGSEPGLTWFTVWCYQSHR